ncbi:MAG: hypothetical protein M1813_002062 [Trichoglossum hirsutum]|nr:MAG: hypothetical protein M1813_002062 [Trichoglossum hirsutum]
MLTSKAFEDETCSPLLVLPLKLWQYRDSPTPESTSPLTKIWWAPVVPSLQLLPPSSLPLDADIAAGITYQSFCISPSRYLEHLLSLCMNLRVKTQTAAIESISEIFQLPSCQSAAGIMNCTGLSARRLVGDDAVYPTKGQTVIVKGEAERISARVGGKWDASVVPRPGLGVTFLGGCKLVDDWYGSFTAIGDTGELINSIPYSCIRSTNIDDDITHWILERCRPLAPELLNEDGEFEVVSVHIGRRPSRQGGARVELEWMEFARGEKKFVCHNYGHHSSGYENSVGAAKEAVNLALSSFNPLK